VIVQVIRKRIIEEGLRVDGRQLDEVRPLYCESNTYPLLHGSALFSRGDTQVCYLPYSLYSAQYQMLQVYNHNSHTIICQNLETERKRGCIFPTPGYSHSHL
jgi:polyribonucleotide nucleotidyltransferase